MARGAASPDEVGSELRAITAGSSQFFGFHDLTPWNPATGELICLRTKTPEDHVPTHSDQAEVVVIGRDGATAEVVGTTRSWNWQKAARQRWLPALGRRVIAYNCETPERLACRLRNLDSGEERTFPHALYDICDHRSYGLGLSFCRLYKLQPGYGYDHPRLNAETDPARVGILRTDLADGATRTILCLEDFLEVNGIESTLGEHYFTHIQISPDGTRYAFIHRCFLESGGLMNNLVVANAASSEHRIVLRDKVSHFDWADGNRLVAWCRANSAIKALKEARISIVANWLHGLSRRIRIGAIRQAVYREAFREVDLTTCRSAILGKGVLTEDGHPQINPIHPDIWVLDTYPGPDNHQTLMLYNQASNQRVDIARLATPSSVKETCWRCDLHPRWHPDGNRVCIDSAHLGRRQLFEVDVSAQLQRLRR
jgi:hypothetical protein